MFFNLRTFSYLKKDQRFSDFFMKDQQILMLRLAK